ncbi:MAG: HAD-IA family hydrolase [Lachnospiraceae bacterium]|nr:HAD-IA family hydrolase [Lachnospiraceae bacterium]
MSKYDHILFDLDGTLTDSGPGIINGFEYSLGKMGIDVPDKASLRKFVGPPLGDSFEKTLGFSPEDAAKGIAFYKEYYAEKGVYENDVYPGIPELLEKLKASGKKLIVATTKAELMADVVMDHFGLRKYFDLIVASNNADRKNKIDVLNFAIENGGVDRERSVMVGDRFYDITGAAHFGIESVGVLYGYGSRQELEEAGATYIAESVDSLYEILL